MAKDQHPSGSRRPHDFALDEMKRISKPESGVTKTEKQQHKQRRAMLMVVAATIALTDPEFHILINHDDVILNHVCKNPHLTTGNIAEILHPKTLKRIHSQLHQTDFLYDISRLPAANENALKIVVQNANRLKPHLGRVHDRIMENVYNHKACTTLILKNDIGKKWLDQNENNEAIAEKKASGKFADQVRSVLDVHVADTTAIHNKAESMQDA